MTFCTRFAPSPTGPLHLGHAYSAMLAHDRAQANQGRFLLRIEDIDRDRARSEWEEQIYEDLSWLGLRWETPVLRQSRNMQAYRVALDYLWSRGLLYPCHCNRRDIQGAASAPQEGAPLLGPDGIVYPGTCRGLSRQTGLPVPENVALRLDFDAAARLLPKTLSFQETGAGDRRITETVSALHKRAGDVVVSRRDMGTAYHLSVVVDDAAQGVTEITRGEDLMEATMIHVALQHLLGLPTPAYHHHRLIRDEEGKRLAKRDDARAISLMRAEGATPSDIRRRVGLPV